MMFRTSPEFVETVASSIAIYSNNFVGLFAFIQISLGLSGIRGRSPISTVDSTSGIRSGGIQSNKSILHSEYVFFTTSFTLEYHSPSATIFKDTFLYSLLSTEKQSRMKTILL